MRAFDGFLGGDGRLPALLGPAFSPVLEVERSPGQPPLLTAGLTSDHAVAGLTGRLNRRSGGAVGRRPAAGRPHARGRPTPCAAGCTRSRWTSCAACPVAPWWSAPGRASCCGPRPAGRAGCRCSTARRWSPAGWSCGPAAGSRAPPGPAVSQRAPAAGDALGGADGSEWAVEASPVTLRLDAGRLGHGPLWLSGGGVAVGLRGSAAAGDAAAGPNASAAVRMRLGLPGATLLALAPTLAGVVSPAAVYEAPVGGWIDRPLPGGRPPRDGPPARQGARRRGPLAGRARRLAAAPGGPAVHRGRDPGSQRLPPARRRPPERGRRMASAFRCPARADRRSTQIEEQMRPRTGPDRTHAAQVQPICPSSAGRKRASRQARRSRRIGWKPFLPHLLFNLRPSAVLLHWALTPPGRAMTLAPGAP